MKDDKKILCTVCGNEVLLDALKYTGMYSYRYKGNKYKVYEYNCPVCSNKTFVSEKFLEEHT